MATSPGAHRTRGVHGLASKNDGASYRTSGPWGFPGPAVLRIAARSCYEGAMERSGPLAALLLLVVGVGPAGAAVSTACARLGDGVGKRVDVDTFAVSGNGGNARLTLEQRPDARNAGSKVLLRIDDMRRRSAFPLTVDVATENDDDPRVVANISHRF